MAWLWLHRHEYEVIHVIHGRLHAFPAVVAGNWLGKPVIIKPGRGGEEHFDLSVVRRKRLFGRFFARAIRSGATAWVANSREIAEDLERWSVPPERVHAIPNGVAVPGDGGCGMDDGITRFLCMGRLDPEKGVDQMIRAFSTLPKEAPVQLVVLGDGLCKSQLMELAKQTGQTDRVTFPGAVDDVAPFLQKADFYVSASHSEGMSNALLEAMSFARPPIVSKVSGVSETVVDRVSGLLFPAGDEEALATLLNEAMMMPLERRYALGNAARDVVRAHFSLDFVVARNLILYENLLKASRETKPKLDGDAPGVASRLAARTLPSRKGGSDQTCIPDSRPRR